MGTVDMGDTPLAVERECQDCPAGQTEVVMRLETSRGYLSYAVNYERFAQRVEELWPTITEMIPGFFKPLLDSFLFGIRHGPLQKMAKAQGIDANAFLKEKGRDKDGGALALLAYLMFNHTRKLQTMEGGEIVPLDIEQRDIADAYEGIIRRTPLYDALPPASLEEPTETPEPLALDPASARD